MVQIPPARDVVPSFAARGSSVEHCRGHRRRPGRDEDAGRGRGLRAPDRPSLHGAQPRPAPGRAARDARARAADRAAGAPRRRGGRAGHTVHDRSPAWRGDRRRQPGDRRRADPGLDDGATRAAGVRRQRRQRRDPGRAPLRRRPRSSERRHAHDRHRDRRRADRRRAALSWLDRRGCGARPYGDRGRRAALSGQLPEPRLRGGARLRHRDRPRRARGGRAGPRLGARAGAGGRRRAGRQGGHRRGAGR